MGEALAYREWPPPAPLRDTVRCVWALWGADGVAPAAAQPIVPDGCPEIVLNLADPFVRAPAGGAERTQPLAMFVGQITGPALVRPSGSCRLVGIRLQPWGAAAWVAPPVAELVDTFLPLGDVLSGALEALHQSLVDLPPDRWADTVFAHLGAARQDTHRPEASAALAASVVEEIGARRGRVTVRGIARRFHVSERTVERVLRERVGLPPRVLARIVRLQDALGRLLVEPGVPLGRVAMDSGYYDQAHFTREFRRLVGCTPSSFLGDDRSLTDPFIQGAGALTPPE